MTVPAFLLAVNGEVHVYALCFHPDFLDFLQLHQIVCGAGAIDNVHGSVVCTVIQHIINHGTQRRKPDTSCDKQQVLSFQLGIYRKVIPIWPADGNLVAYLETVEIVGQHTAFLDAEFLIFFVGR